MTPITYLTRIEFEHGALAQLPELAVGLGIGTPMIDTDKGIVAAGPLDRVRVALGDTSAAVFSDTPTNPTEGAVLDALELYRGSGSDGLIAIGRGSSIDLAKGVALLATHDGPLAQYAALEGGLTFQKWLGAIHALSHPPGGLKSVSLHHGMLNAVLLPFVLDWNEPACTEKFAIIRPRLGLAPNTSLPAYFAALNGRLKLPSSLREMGLPEAELEPVSVAATKDHSSATNPRSCSADDYLAPLRAAHAA